MIKEPTEIARFAFGIRGIIQPDHQVGYFSDNDNERVPKEVVILKLKALVKRLEKEYFE